MPEQVGNIFDWQRNDVELDVDSIELMQSRTVDVEHPVLHVPPQHESTVSICPHAIEIFLKSWVMPPLKGLASLGESI